MNSNGDYTPYDEQKYEEALNEIKKYLRNMLDYYMYDKSVKYLIKGRIKSTKSINDKIKKKKKEKGANFDIQLDLQDIAGLRVVFCDEKFKDKPLPKLDEEIHNYTSDMFEYNFRNACFYEDNCTIVDIFNFLQFLENNNSNNIIIIKDYITNPKQSGYQSLHVLFMASNGYLVEVQFRNYVQHLFNEYEHDHYKGSDITSQKRQYIFKICAQFLEQKTNEALLKFFKNNQSSKKIALTRQR